MRDSDARKLAYETAGKYALMQLPPSPEDEQFLNEALDSIQVAGDPDRRLKFIRYILGSRLLGHAMRHIVVGDGPEAQFTHWVDTRTDSSTPYQAFRRSVQATFAAGWGRFVDQTPEAELEYMRRRYEDSLDTDPSTQATGGPVKEGILKTGVELGQEVTIFGLTFSLAVEKHSALQTTSPDELLHVARDASASLARRGRTGLSQVFWSGQSYANQDLDSMYLTQTANGHYRFTKGKSHPYFFNPPLSLSNDPVVHCMADLVHIWPNDTRTAMENSIYAGVNALHAQGLLNTHRARKLWDQRVKMTICAQPEIEALRQEYAKFGRNEVIRAITAYNYDQIIYRLI